MSAPILLIVRTARRRYAVRRDDVSEIRLLDAAAPSDDPSLLRFDLGALLDPSDRSSQARRRALIVPLRRKQIALMFDALESFEQHTTIVPLPPLLQARLGAPWATGALVLDDELIVQIDVRAVSRSAMLRQPAVV